MLSGDLALPSGDMAFPSGDLDLNSGELALTSGDLLLRSGDLILISDLPISILSCSGFRSRLSCAIRCFLEGTTSTRSLVLLGRF